MDVGNLISVSSAFSKTSLNIWKFSIHVQLKPLVYVEVLSHFESFEEEAAAHNELTKPSKQGSQVWVSKKDCKS